MKYLNDSELLTEIKSAVLEERKITLKILQLLKQVEARNLHTEQGYDSLFTFTVKYLGYSETAAGRRISAMRLLREIPEVESKIISGELNLTNIAQAQSHFRHEAKTQPLLKEEKLELLKSFENKSIRECEKIILAKSPESIPQERRRELTETKTELKLILSEAPLQNLDRLKNLWSHKNPNMSDSEAVEAMIEFCLNKVDPLRKSPPAPEVEKPGSQATVSSKQLPVTENRNPLTADRSPPRSRYIPVNTKHKIWQRDQGKCQFVNKETGEVCESQRFIQIDHKYPYAFGGKHDPQNLQLLCATHNKLRAAEVFPSWSRLGTNLGIKSKS